VVHYDTTVDSVVSGDTVVDISGNGNHATLYNGAAYSSTDRALTFDGVNGYLAGTQNLGTGTPAHTISGWFKRTASLSQYTWIFTIGTSDTGEMSGLLIDPSGDIVFDIFNHRIETTHTITNNTWYHFVGVFNGGTSTWSVDTCDVYINGVLETTQTTGTDPQNFNLTGNQIYFGTSTDFLRYFTGQISNFKLWNVALTAEEVAMEYALGRTGKSINLTDTVLCLGGTVPRAQLDVRGSVYINGIVGTGPTDGIIIPYGTTAQQPTGQTGMLRFNTTLGRLQVYDGTNWIVVGGMSATGGTVTYVDGYTIHTFTDSGDFRVYSAGDVEYLIVAGGGGGGSGDDVSGGGGGGGAGGMLTGTVSGLVAGDYNIVVGSGGPSNNSGVNSTALNLTAIGGGRGRDPPNDGGSGGGGYRGIGGSGTSGQGNNGGTGRGSATTRGSGGAGGGAGAVGGNGTSGDNTTGGNGGNGLQSSISGTATYYAGGGGGGGQGYSGVSRSAGGQGGGGQGGGQSNSSTARLGLPGTDGLGGGGGGSSAGSGTNGLPGGAGGDGIVIIRYLT